MIWKPSPLPILLLAGVTALSLARDAEEKAEQKPVFYSLLLGTDDKYFDTDDLAVGGGGLGGNVIVFVNGNPIGSRPRRRLGQFRPREPSIPGKVESPSPFVSIRQVEGTDVHRTRLPPGRALLEEGRLDA
ncbi:MAG: hypothetical protein O7J95_08310 [Planctomycetota bacterium]|nr:hypothetical protein [Planctomycetota bacterium]